MAACATVVIGLIVAAVAWLTAAQRDPSGRGDAPASPERAAAAWRRGVADDTLGHCQGCLRRPTVIVGAASERASDLTRRKFDGA
jgi:hypothetical protein